MTPIPFNRPCLIGRELEYMQQCMQQGRTCGNGPFTKQCQAFLEKTLSVHRSVLTTSCTHALEMAALLLDLKPGDEVIVPSFTFVSTANAFVLHGARPVFCDIRPDTLNMDEMQLPRLITDRTRAIVPVHYAGVGCEMDAIMELANAHGIAVIEDNAHGLFGKYKNKYLGSLGAMATQSFHETKNFTSGEGGALLINDPKYVERAEIIHEKGTDRSRFFRGQVDKYTWVDVGSSYVMSEVLAAYLLAQIEAHETIQSKRRAIWEFYNTNLRDWAATNGVRLPSIPSHCGQAYHMFYMLMPSLEERQALICELKGNGISSVFHYIPLHNSTMGQKFGARPRDCPVTEDVSDRLLRLPMYYEMTEHDLQRVVAAISKFSCKAAITAAQFANA